MASSSALEEMGLKVLSQLIPLRRGSSSDAGWECRVWPSPRAAPGKGGDEGQQGFKAKGFKAKGFKANTTCFWQGFTCYLVLRQELQTAYII